MKSREDGMIAGFVVSVLALLALCTTRVWVDVAHGAWTFETTLATALGAAFAALAARAALRGRVDG